MAESSSPGTGGRASKPPTPPSESKIIGRLGKFDLVRELGRGGMGVVYEAFDTALKRRCALKLMIQPAGLDPAEAKQDQERFLREARLCANVLKHPFLVQVYEAGVAAGKHFFAMELVEGRSLGDWRKTGPPPLRKQVALLRDVLIGIQYAHDHGVVHRDLKPENVLVDDRDQPHIVDFGLAKTVDGKASLSLTTSGTLMGTPFYMSPEQARNSKTVDGRTDVWAVGVMLFQILTGKLPFTGDSAFDVLMKVSKDVVPSPSSVLAPGAAREWDEPIERICLKALAKDPFNRYATAGDFASDLIGWLEGRTIQVALPRRYTVYRLKKAHVLTGAGVAAGLVLALLGLLLLRRPAPVPDLQAREKELQARQADLDARARKTAEADAAVRQARLDLERKDSESRRKADEEARTPSGPLEPISADDRPPRQTLTGHAEAPQSFKFTPDGKSILSGAADLTVRRWDLDTGASTFIMNRHPVMVRAIDLSGDGRRVASVDYEGRMLLSDALTGAEIRAFPKQVTYLEGVAFTPDGKTLANACRDGKARLYDVESGEERVALDTGGRGLALAISPDGRWLAIGNDKGELRVWSLPDLQPVPMDTGHTGWIRWIFFDAKSERILVAGNHPIPTLWNMKTRKMERPLLGHPTAVTSAAISPDGFLAVTGAQEGMIKIWNTGAGREVRTVTGLRTWVSALAFSPDGKTLALGGQDRRVRLWTVDDLLRP